MPGKPIAQLQNATDSTEIAENVSESLVFTKDTGYIMKEREESLPEQFFSEKLQFEPQPVSVIQTKVADNISDNFITALIFIGFLLIALLKSGFKINLWNESMQILQFRSSNFEDKTGVRRISDIILVIISFIALSLTYLQLSKHFKIFYSEIPIEFESLIFGLLLILLSYLLTFINHILAYIFQDETYSDYNIILNQLLSGIGIPLFLLISAQYFSPENGFLKTALLYASAALLGLSYLMKTAKYIYINYLHKLRIYYMFLYLCSLEAVPLLIAFRFYSAE